MALNGTELMDNPWETIFSPFTDMFESVIGNGAVFYLLILISLTFGVYIKTENPTMCSMFMIASGALLGGASIFTEATDIAVAFTVFTAIGIATLFISLFFQR